MPSLQMRLARYLQVGRRDDCYRDGCRLASAARILHVRMQLGAATSTMAAYVDCEAVQGNTPLSNAPHSCSHNQHVMFACHVAASSSHPFIPARLPCPAGAFSCVDAAAEGELLVPLPVLLPACPPEAGCGAGCMACGLLYAWVGTDL
jgi:hypothetical protein